MAAEGRAANGGQAWGDEDVRLAPYGWGRVDGKPDCPLTGIGEDSVVPEERDGG